MSLFAAVFGEAQHASAGGSGLFSASNKFATQTKKAPEQQSTSEQQQQQQQHDAGPSGKKRRRPEAAAAPSAEQQHRDKKPKKKQQKAEQEQPQSEAAAPARKQQTKAAAGAAAKPAAQAVAKPAARAASQKAGPPADDDPRLPRTVFVGNLPADVKRKAVARFFAPCGAVESVRLRSLPLKREPGSKLPRRGAIASGAVDAEHSGHAYVVFEGEEAVEAALKLNMSEFSGRHVRVDRAAPRAAKGAVAFDPSRSLFVGNLARDAEDEELIQLFGPECIEAVRIVRDGRTGEGKGVAFVLFRDQEAAKAALRQKEMQLGGRALRLTRAKKQEARGKAAWQQGSSSGGGGGGGKAGGGGGAAAGKRKAGGKRPAVAARKAVAKQQQRQQGRRERQE